MSATTKSKLPHIWIAIANSSLSDEQTKRDKSIKTAQIARACAIFGVRKIFIYPDKISMIEQDDPTLLKTILRYLDTPQYLRKILCPRMNLLEYAGILPPIKAPHHKPWEDVKQIKVGDIRTGVLAKIKGQFFVEAGLGFPIPFEGTGHEGKKVNIKFTSPHPNLKTTEALDDEIDSYWGYEVKEVPSLDKLFASIQGTDTEIVLTSKKGKNFRNVQERFTERAKNAKNVLIVFGAPKHGLHELAAKEGGKINSFDFTVNMFPNQNTETVRLEEAVLGTLSIVNHSLY